MEVAFQEINVVSTTGEMIHIARKDRELLYGDPKRISDLAVLKLPHHQKEC